MRYVILFVSIASVVFTIISCGKEEEENLKPTSGSAPAQDSDDSFGWSE